MESLVAFNYYSWILIPLMIFFARVMDQSVGTMRIIFVSKGKKVLAAALGFLEALIWIIVISQVIQNLDNFLCYLAYAGGFAVGNYVGIIIEEKLAMGVCLLRVMTRKNSVQLQESLKEQGYGFVNLSSDDIDGHENVIFVIVRRKEIPFVVGIIKKFNENAFFSIEDLRSVNEGEYPLKKTDNSEIGFKLKSWARGGGIISKYISVRK